jgi:hypothetical protein
MVASNAFAMNFDTNSVSAKITAYQSKLLEIAKANVDLSFSYAQAVTALKTPAELTTINTDFSKKQIEMFRWQTKELAGLAILGQP